MVIEQDFATYPLQHITKTLGTSPTQNSATYTLSRHRPPLSFSAPTPSLGETFNSNARGIPSRLDSISRNMSRILRHGVGPNECELTTLPEDGGSALLLDIVNRPAFIRYRTFPEYLRNLCPEVGRRNKARFERYESETGERIAC